MWDRRERKIELREAWMLDMEDVLTLVLVLIYGLEALFSRVPQETFVATRLEVTVLPA